ncbi:MAG: response regulator transcription factor [Cellulosilyticaceae bacterium]
MRILLVEDEEYMAQGIAKVLENNNYTVDLAHDGEYGLDCVLSGIYDIVVLDIMLPKIDGLEILKRIRKEKITVPILLLTAKGETEDKVKGLDLGADDYLPKPFVSDELLARIRALARRRGEITLDNTHSFGDIVLNPNTLYLSCGKNLFNLTLKESQILDLLIEAKGNIISKNTIIEKVWGFDSEAEDSHVEVYISFLRKKLKSLSSHTSIKTIRGLGYSLQNQEEKLNV